MRYLLPSVAIVFSAAVGCAPAAPTHSPAAVDLAAEERAIRDLDAQWLKAVETGDFAGEGRFFASDGIAYRDNALLTGPPAIADYNARNLAANPKLQVTWTTTGVTVAESGDLAVQTGEVQTSGLGADGAGQDRSRFLTVWKKVDGAWKVAHDMSMSTMPRALQ